MNTLQFYQVLFLPIPSLAFHNRGRHNDNHPIVNEEFKAWRKLYVLLTQLVNR